MTARCTVSDHHNVGRLALQAFDAARAPIGRDTDGREVDFVVVDGRTPTLLVEAKWGDVEVDRSLKYLKARFPAADAWQISATGTQDYVSPEGIRVAPALALLGQLA